MSHIGSRDIRVPNNVVVEVLKESIQVKGDLGALQMPYFYVNVELIIENNSTYLRVSPMKSLDNGKIANKSNALWGTYRTLLDNMIIGVSQGYNNTLELVGVGYKAHILNNKTLVLKVGNTIDLYYEVPHDVSVDCPKSNLINIFGINKQRVNQVAAEIRSYRIPESYKGKGIRYLGEVVRTKEGKKK